MSTELQRPCSLLLKCLRKPEVGICIDQPFAQPLSQVLSAPDQGTSLPAIGRFLLIRELDQALPTPTRWKWGHKVCFCLIFIFLNKLHKARTMLLKQTKQLILKQLLCKVYSTMRLYTKNKPLNRDPFTAPCRRDIRQSLRGVLVWLPCLSDYMR